MKKTLICGALLVIMTMFVSCGGYGTTELVNTTEFESSINLDMDFDTDDITFLISDDDKIILKEYMNKDKEKYYANIESSGDKIKMTEGDRPLSSNFNSFIEVYLPRDYSGSVNAHSTSGLISCAKGFENLHSSKFDTTSGEIKVKNLTTANLSLISTNGIIAANNIESENIKIRNTNGNTTLDNVAGTFDYVGKGGNLKGKSLSGSGNYEMTGDGKIELAFSHVEDSISIFSKNESISVNLPSELSFNFSGTIKNGKLKTNFEDKLKNSGNSKVGIIGKSPDIDVNIESRNGDIEVNLN